MKITSIDIYSIATPLHKLHGVKAFASVIIEDCFAIRQIKIIHGQRGLFIAMPKRKRKNGGFQDIAHPIKHATREHMERLILEAYKQDIQNPRVHDTHRYFIHYTIDQITVSRFQRAS